MQLVGMLDSPFVRRVAVSLRLLDLPFEHRPVSVFTTFEEFRRVNPVVKAPTLVCDDGTILMDSTLILLYAERVARGKSLWPQDLHAMAYATRCVGLALAACEKCAQYVYEQNLRPPEKWHRPWLDRVQGQATSAFGLLEAAARERPFAATSDAIDQAGISAAIAFKFAESMVPDFVSAAQFPHLAEHSQRAESLPFFAAFPPDGPGVPNPSARGC